MLEGEVGHPAEVSRIEIHLEGQEIRDFRGRVDNPLHKGARHCSQICVGGIDF